MENTFISDRGDGFSVVTHSDFGFRSALASLGLLTAVQDIRARREGERVRQTFMIFLRTLSSNVNKACLTQFSRFRKADGSVKDIILPQLMALLVIIGSICFISRAPAAAGCPPFDFKNSYSMVDIAKQFEDAYRRNPPKAGQSEEAYLLDLWKRGVLKVSPAFILPVRGPIPLAVGAICLWCGCAWCSRENEPVVITFNPGDGTPEIPVSNKPLEAVTYAYKQPGQFQATVRLEDRQGRISTHTVLITAMDFAAFEAELKGYWMAMKEALLRGDISEPLECLHSYSRSKYQKQLTEIMSGGSQRIDREFGTLELRERREDGTIIFLRSVAGGGSEVYFHVDFDGFWRIIRF